MADKSSFVDLGPRWYVVHTYTGYENKVKANLEKIIENRNLGDRIFECLVPTETVVETVNGTEKEVEVKLYPSYVFVKMRMSPETWHVVRNIIGVTGFVGPGSKPEPLRDDEVVSMGIESRVIELKYAVGDSVRAIAGPLPGFVGVVKDISEDKKKIVVLMSMFGRETPVELNAEDVEKLEI